MTSAVVERKVRVLRAVFASLGAALSDLQIYSAQHQRFATAVDRYHALLEDFFSATGEEKLTLAIGDGLEVDGQSVVPADPSSERLLYILGRSPYEELEIRAGVTLEDCARLVTAISEISTRGRDENIDGELDAGGDEDGQPRFRFTRGSRPRSSAAVTPTPPATPPAMPPGQGAAPVTGDAGGAETTDAEQSKDVEVSDDTRHGADAAPGTGDNEDMPTPEERVLRAHAAVACAYRAAIAAIREPGSRRVDLNGARKAVKSLVRAVFELDESRIPSEITTYGSDPLIDHSANVCLIAIMIAAEESRDPLLVQSIALGALAHDIGKTELPDEVLQRSNEFRGKELALAREHPVVGARMLIELTGADAACASVAFTHHLSGVSSRLSTPYPDTRRTVYADWIADLVATADVFEALIAPRPFKSAFGVEKDPTMREALETLRLHIGESEFLSRLERIVERDPLESGPTTPMVAIKDRDTLRLFFAREA